MSLEWVLIVMLVGVVIGLIIGISLTRPIINH